MNKLIKLLFLLFKILVIISLLCILIIIAFILYIYIMSPSINMDSLYKEESSNLYDSNNVLIATIGSEKRELITYEELPQVLIDAIIATEDARFYMHNGFDAKRFLKASFSQIFSNTGGGASTLQMQLSKNTFTSTESKGINGIIRKFTDIYIAVFKINNNYSKKEILEFYVNSPYLGSSSYGVKMASKTYFNKDVSDLTLVEAALIAGLFKGPSEYDPNINIDKANERKNTVLSLMYRHGYITKDEYNSSLNINVKDILSVNNLVNPYQSFIDTTVQEVIDNTGYNPYTVSMDIYTTMNRSNQDVINNLYNTYTFLDDKIETGIIVLDNNNGSILAVGAGRNKNAQMTFNYATSIKRHPGSTAKPLFDYGPGIEYNGWSSVTLFKDEKISYSTGGYIRNIDDLYLGTLTLKDCLVKSRNTCALAAFKSVKNSDINSFVTSLGITPEYLYDNTYINEAHSIGGFNGVSPLTLAGAYQAFANGGIYNEPHSYTKIVYKTNDGNVEEERKYESHRAMKETTAYIISNILLDVTSYKSKINNTEIATKTGTSSYDDDTLKSLNLPKTVVQDSWTVTFSKNHTISVWLGYDELNTTNYMTNNQSFTERVNIQSLLVKNIINEGDKFTIPSGIVYTTSSYMTDDGEIKTFKGIKAK